MWFYVIVIVMVCMFVEGVGMDWGVGNRYREDKCEKYLIEELIFFGFSF